MANFKFRITTIGFSIIFFVSGLSIHMPKAQSATSQSDTSSSEKQTSPVFRFHMPTEPHSLDPARLQRGDANYFYGNLMRGLIRFSSDAKLVFDGAESCRFSDPLRLTCTLNKNAKWSDGSPVTAQDYLRSFQHMMGPDAKNPAAELFSHIQNANDVHAGKKPVSTLGILAPQTHTLIFDFAQADPEFLFKLTSSLLVPIKSEKFPDMAHAQDLVVNGPYKIVSWKVGQRMRLEANPLYEVKSAQLRPPVEILFIDDDETAFNLYLNGELTFLRSLPSTNIPKYKDRPDFVQVPQARFDYVGFGPDLKDQDDLRAALSYSADFHELQIIYNALGIPGCTSLPESVMQEKVCLKFDLEKAKRHLAKVSPETLKKRLPFLFSKLSYGADIKKGAEWMQAQWKKNLGLDVDLQESEQGVFLSTLKSHPPAIFRRAVSMDRPTCLAGLEAFASKSLDNYIQLKDPAYDALLGRLAKVSMKPEGKKICSEGIQYLLDRHLLIPLGRIHFTMLVKPEFKGWTLNEMNQLDLTELKYVTSPTTDKTNVKH